MLVVAGLFKKKFCLLFFVFCLLSFVFCFLFFVFCFLVWFVFCFLFVLFFLFFVFFFQAEDGIRDAVVTGVQTCALPISDDVDEGGALVLDRGSNQRHQLS